MIYLNGKAYPEELAREGRLQETVKQSGEDCEFAIKTARFIEEFFDDRTYVEVLTSGSTGVPKLLQADKARMKASAQMTLDYLGLQPGQTALLCMPLSRIAGKMLAVRALIGGLRLITVTPCANPFLQAPPNLDFAAITPMQAFCSLEDPASAKTMASCRKIIIGGGFIEESLAARLCELPSAIYHSYGMTETLSHIALRRISPENSLFVPLAGVSVRLSKEGTLIIDAPRVCPERLVTHDLAEITDKGFVILGRSDNIINSGGIKLIPESIEKKLGAVLRVPFAISSRPHPKFGEELILVSEAPLSEELKTQAFTLLDKYEKPKNILVRRLPRTATQKIDRLKLKAEISKLE